MLQFLNWPQVAGLEWKPFLMLVTWRMSNLYKCLLYYLLMIVLGLWWGCKVCASLGACFWLAVGWSHDRTQQSSLLCLILLGLGRVKFGHYGLIFRSGAFRRHHRSSIQGWDVFSVLDEHHQLWPYRCLWFIFYCFNAIWHLLWCFRFNHVFCTQRTTS